MFKKTVAFLLTMSMLASIAVFAVPERETVPDVELSVEKQVAQMGQAELFDRLSAIDMESLTPETEEAPEDVPAAYTAIQKGQNINLEIFVKRQFIQNNDTVKVFIGEPDAEVALFHGTVTMENCRLLIEDVPVETELYTTVTGTKGDQITEYYGHAKIVVRNPDPLLEDAVPEEKYIRCTTQFSKITRKAPDSIRTDLQILERAQREFNIASNSEIAPLGLSEKFEKEPNGSILHAMRIEDDDTIKGKVLTSNDADYFKIMFNSVGRANFWLGDIPAGQTYALVLTNEQGDWLEVCSSGVESQSIFNYLVEPGVVYYILVTGMGDSYDSQNYYTLRPKNYPISETDDFGNSHYTAFAVNTESVTSGAINYTDDKDYFKITPTVTGRYNFRVVGNTPVTAALFNSELTQINFSGSAELQHDLTANQTYYLAITGDGDVTGSYQLKINQLVMDDYGGSFNTAYQITTNQPYEGSIDWSGDVDFFYFIPQTVGDYLITITSQDESVEFNWAFYNSSQTVIESNFGNDSFFGGELLQGRRYYIKIFNFNGDYGNYTLRISQPQEDDYADTMNNATVIPMNQTFYGTVSHDADYDVFKFVAPQNGVYRVSATGSGDFAPIAFVSDINWNEPMRTKHRPEGVRLHGDLVSGKTYYVHITTRDGLLGDYTVLVQPGVDDYPNSIAEVEESTTDTLLINNTYQGRLDYAGDVDFVAFKAAFGDSSFIYSTGTTDTACVLYAPDKITVLAESDDFLGDNNFRVALTMKGTYYLMIYSTSDDVGDYSIKSGSARAYDVGLSNQWGIRNLGQEIKTDPNEDVGVLGALGVDVNVMPVWNYSTGEGVKVAVLDTGIQTTHEDLAVNMLPGYNFVHNTSNVYPVPPEEELTPSGNVAAVVGHGTNVAGIIAAAKDNNRTGVVGVAPDAEIIPLKTMGNVNGTVDSSVVHAISAIQYAIEHGAKIINNSWGSKTQNPELEGAIRDNPNILFVCGAGNNKQDMDINSNRIYPACYDYPNNIAVTAMDSRGYISGGCNFRGNTALAAPGERVYTTSPDNTYEFFNGTSVAAPFVSGVAALIWSYFPSLTATQVASRIVNNVTPSFNLQDLVTSGGYLNAFKAFANENSATTLMQVSNDTPKSSSEIKGEVAVTMMNMPEEIKTNEIFVNLLDETQINSILSENLEGFQYEIIKQMEMSGSYLVGFDTIEAAEQAISILNGLNEVYYASMNNKISID